MAKDREKEIYEKIRELKEGNMSQRKVAIECEKILADECSNKTLNEKLDLIFEMIDEIE